MTNIHVSWKSAGKVNFLKPRVLKRRAWTTLNVISTLAIVFNTGMVGVLLTPNATSAANPSANLDQCANGPLATPNDPACNPDEWVNGNVNESKAHYVEGDSVPYRMKFDNLTLASHTVTIEWDTTKSGKHALDYLTSFDRTVTTANPCTGIAGCGAATTFPIPADSQVTGAGVTPIAGNFTLYGGTITSASAYSYPDGTGFAGDKSARITLTFTATQANPVLAWGGHIATRADWGASNSAVAISGSPYHMRLINLDGAGGNQDRSLAAAAVIFPASITIVKQATPEGGTSFDYTTTGGLTPASFSLIDDGTATNTKTFSGITNFTTYTVTEQALAGWALTFNSPVCTVTSANGGSQSKSGSTVTINLKEGENVTCTFKNAGSQNLQIKKYVRNVTDDANVASNWYTYDAGQILPVLPGATVEYKVIVWNPGTAAGNATVTDVTSNAALYDPNYSGGTLYTSVSIPNQSGAAMPAVTTPAGTGAYWKIVTYQKAVDATSTSGTANSINTATLNGSANSKAKIAVTYTCNFEVVKDGPATVNYTANGAQITYTLNYDNNGTGSCTGGGVVVKDTIPAGTTFASAPVSPAYTLNNGIIQWNLGTVAAGASGSLSFTVNVTNNQNVQCGSWTIDNQASFYSTQELWDTTNTVTTTVYKSCLKVQKVVVGGTAKPEAFGFHLNQNDPYVYPAANTDFVIFSNLTPGQYTATEADPSGLGYSQTNTTCNNVNVTAGATATCSITNTRDTGDLIVHKNVLNPDGQEVADTHAFSVLLNGDDQKTIAEGTDATYSNLPTGTYTIVENPDGDYTFVSYSADSDVNTAGAQVTIVKNQTTELTVTNKQKKATITIYKDVRDYQGNDVADATSFDVTSNAGDFNIAEGSPEVLSVNPGTYTFTEAAHSNYTIHSTNPKQLTVGSNGSASYTFVNWQKTGSISGMKFEDVNGNGQKDQGEPGLENWTICYGDYGATVAAPTCVLTDVNGNYTFNNVPAGTYDIWEVLKNGWQQTTPNGLYADVVVGVNQTLSGYDFGNFKLGRIWGYKLDTLGNHLPGWQICLNANTCTTTDGNGMYEFTGLTAGNYVVAETLQAGWWAVTPLIPGYIVSIQSGSNEQRDFTNFDGIDLKVTKLMDADGNLQTSGDQTAKSGWTIEVWKDGNLLDTQLTGLDGTYTWTNLGPGNYTVKEIFDNTVYQALTPVQDTFTAVSGQNEEVTFVNFKTPKLTVIKHVINDNGGTASADDFTMTVGGNNVSDNSFPGDENGTTVTLNAGAYSVDELAFPGYAKSLGQNCSGTVYSGDEVTCTITNDDIQPKLTVTKIVINNDGGDAVVSDFDLFVDATQVVSGVQNGFNTGSYVVSEATVTQPGYTGTITGDCDVNGNVTLGLADVKSCTITNNDLGASITLVKTVINDNGGTALPNDFQLTIGGTPTLSGVALPVQANTPYALDETQVQGYSFVSLTGDAKCPRALAGTVTLDEGENITCTITNDDIQPKLTVTKVVTNDNGGTAVVADFPLFVDQTSVVSGVQNGFNADDYVVSETNLPGYSATISGDCDANGNVSLKVGDVKSCTITNDDIQPKLTVTKVVTNDNGGTAVVADFPLFVDQTGVVSGVQNGFNADDYVVSETNLPGYSATISGDCDKDGSITLHAGDVKSCTITNNDVAPKLKLIKNVTNDNGGTKVVADFPLFINGNGVTSGQWNTLTAGVQYTATETSDPGYQASVWGGDCAANGTITLDVGDAKVCTITNDDIQPKLTVTKIVVNDNGGNAVVSDFPLFVDATGVTSGVQNGFNADTYTISETNLSGYTAAIGGDCDKNGSITLGVGDVKACTITNDDVAPTITLNKVVDINYGGTAGVNDFGLTIGGTAVDSGDTLSVAANTPIALNEAGLPKYNFVSITGDAKCPAALNGTVTLDEGENISCTITNEDTPAKITGYKYDWDTENKLDGWEICLQAANQVRVTNLLVDSLDLNISQENCVITGAGEWPTGYYEFTGLHAGTYNVYEHLKYGWTQMDPVDPTYHSVTVAAGDEVNGKDFWNRKNVFNVSIEKTADLEVVQAGANLTYTLNWSVTGNTPVEVKLFDALPANTTFVSADNGGFLDGTTVRWNLGTFNPAANGTVHLTVTVNSPLDKGTIITNTGNICGLGEIADGEPFLSDSEDMRRQKCDDDTTTTTVDSKPLLGIEKTANPTTVGGNQDVTYTVTWSVAGNSKATNVVVNDPIPASTTYVSMGCGTTAGTCTMSQTGTPVSSVTWNLGTRVPGESGTLTLVVKTAISVPNGSVIPNVADIRSAEVDPVFAQADVKATTAPILQITKTANATIVNPGDPISYTVKVKNVGTDVAINAVMTDALPAGFSFVSTNPVAASIVGQTGTWNLGNMNVGDEKTITYTVNVAPGTTAGTYDNIAKAKADNAPEVSTKVPVQTRVPQVLGEQTAPVLQLKKTASKSTVTAGDTFSYTVEIKNTGTGSAINLILTDLLPVGFTFNGSTDTTKEWSLGDLAVGETKTVTYKVKVGSSVPAGSYENLAIAKADNHGKITASAPVNVKRGRVLGEAVDTGAGWMDLTVAATGLGLIVLGFVLTRRKRGEELA